MKNVKNMLIIVVLAVAVGVIVVAKRERSEAPASYGGAASFENAAVRKLPRLVDLGATQCIPCKMMAPILEDLKKTYAGKLAVEFIDVWEHPGAGETYGIKTIPTQIFYDAEGRELWRHEGFLGKDDILNKWQALGVSLDTEN